MENQFKNNAIRGPINSCLLRILPLIFVKIILDKEDQLVGFIIALSSLSKALQKTKGKLFFWMVASEKSTITPY
jgi:hypothetical protein